jgi:putative ubiquitin-RnfH superfamily antitoxin RatB of RatAB toxin-antitoxin module
MKMEKTVRIGVMPGRVNEFAMPVGTTIKEALRIAGLSADGYEIKVNDVTITLNDTAVVNADTTLILLVKAVKGNGLVRIGVMPGRVSEFAIEPGTKVKDALVIAGVSADGYEIKVNDVTATLDTVVTAESSLILLVKQVKGNK